MVLVVLLGVSSSSVVCAGPFVVPPVEDAGCLFCKHVPCAVCDSLLERVRRVFFALLRVSAVLRTQPVS